MEAINNFESENFLILTQSVDKGYTIYTI